MEINKNEFQNALEIVKPGLGTNDSFEQTSSFAFMGDRIVTYNDEISISHPISNLDITGAIKADELVKLLNKIKTETINVEITETEIVITSGKLKAGFILQSEIKLPLDEIDEIKGWSKLPAKFNEFAVRSAANCGHEVSRPILTTVFVSEEGAMVASDGFRLFKATFNPIKNVTGFLIPGNNLREVIKLKPNKISLSNSWVHFKNETGTIISSRTFNDKYPSSVDKVLEISGKDITLPDGILEVLDRASIMGKVDGSSEEILQITLGKNKITVHSEFSAGWLDESIAMRYKDDPISFKMNPALFRSIIAETKECIISEKAIKFSGEDWEYIGLLIL